MARGHMCRPGGLPSTARRLGLLGGLAGAIGAIGAIGCLDTGAQDAAPDPLTCPTGSYADVDAEDAIRRHLQRAPSARPTLRALEDGALSVCFGDLPVSVLQQRADHALPAQALLDRGLSPDDAAARLVHLESHRRRFVPWPEPAPDGDCERRVDAALEAEARAFELELAVRRELGLRDAPRYPFEHAAHAAPAAGRRALIHAFLREHPEGAPALAPLGAAYRTRCLAESASGARG